MSGKSGKHERRASILRPVLDVRIAVQQQPHNRLVSQRTSPRECRIVRRLGRRVDIGSTVEKKRRHLRKKRKKSVEFLADY